MWQNSLLNGNKYFLYVFFHKEQKLKLFVGLLVGLTKNVIFKCQSQTLLN